MKTSSPLRPLRRLRGSRLRGFTAVEIAMVATVIAILALLLIPNFRKTSDEARETGALDEMSSLAKAITLAEADVGGGFLPRLQDLDNGPFDANLTPPADFQDILPPLASWNTALTPAGILNLEQDWNGPYTEFKKFITYAELVQDGINRGGGPNAWFFDDGFPTGNDGPILSLQLAGFADPDPDDDKHPVDPWGNPYIFYGNIPPTPGNDGAPGRVIYSLGPDGLPGDETTVFGPGFYDRTSANFALGRGDDLVFRF